MSLLIAGGTGFIGRSLAQFYRSKGLKVFIVTRNAKTKDELTWGDIKTNGFPNNIKAVVNLCGRNIAEFSPFFMIDKYYQQFQKDVFESRINTTKTLLDIVRKSSIRPEVFINASAIGFYKTSLTETYTEKYSYVDDTVAKICKDWEDAAQAPDIREMRTIQIRIGLVLGSGGGMLQQMYLPYMCGLGGPIGSGEQWTSWIHIDDIIGLIDHTIENKDLSNGPLNGTAPNPVQFREFSETLGRTLHRPTFFSVPSIIIKAIYKDRAILLLEGQRVIPQRALNSGYKFKFPYLGEALRAIYH